MGLFSIRLAPGVRVSLSSRGVRTHLGPRAARIHVGGGRTGISTGAGPVTLYSSLSGTGRRSAATRRASTASARSLTAAAKAQDAQALADAFRHIEGVHRERFDPAKPPVAPSAPNRNVDQLLAAHNRAALAGIGVLQRSARAQARQEARRAAMAELATLQASDEQVRASLQHQLDSAWAAFVANDPAIVLATLADAFEDNDAPAAAVGLDGSAASLIVTVPGIEAVPERYPAITDAGNLSLRKLTKTDRNAWYRRLIYACVLVTAKEAFAVAPGLSATRLVAARPAARDAYGRPAVEAVFACQIQRVALQGVQWDRAGADRIMADTCTEPVIRMSGSAQEVRPLDLASQREIAELMAAVDVDASASADGLASGEGQGRRKQPNETPGDPVIPGGSEPPPPPPPAGWYPDPQGLVRLRYWDGRTWTTQTSG